MCIPSAALVHSGRISATATRSWLFQRLAKSVLSSMASPIRRWIGCSTNVARWTRSRPAVASPRWVWRRFGTLMTRGVLIDIAGLKGVEILPINYEITVADLEQALQKQGISLQPGDAVLIYTGWSKHWGVDNKLYTSGCPGIGVGAAQSLIKQDPLLP